jgi:hypothetical protein
MRQFENSPKHITVFPSGKSEHFSLLIDELLVIACNFRGPPAYVSIIFQRFGSALQRPERRKRSLPASKARTIGVSGSAMSPLRSTALGKRQPAKLTAAQASLPVQAYLSSLS